MAFSSHFKGVLSLESAQFEQGLTKAQSKVKSFNKNLTSMFAGFLGATAVIGFGRNVFNATVKLETMSKRLGVSTDFLQKFNFAMEQSNVSSESAQIGLQRFIRRVQTARDDGGALKDALDRMNISLNNSAGVAKSSEKLFMEFLDGLGKLKTQSERVAMAFKFLDTEGVAMVQAIGNGSKQFIELSRQAEKLGLVLSKDVVKNLSNLDQELNRTEFKLKKLGAKVIAPLINLFNKFITGWQGITQAVKLALIEVGLFIVTLDKFGDEAPIVFLNKLAVGINKLNVTLQKFNPFASDQMVKDAEARLKQVEKIYKETAQNNVATFAEARNKVLSEDKVLNADRIRTIKNLNSLYKESNATLQDSAQINIADNIVTEEKEKIVSRITGETSKLNNELQLQIERIEAIKRGGEEELQIILERQKIEKDITAVMQEGLLTREQAEEKVIKLLELEKEEKQILEQLKLEEEKREEAKKKLSENNALVEKMQEEKLLAQEIQQLIQQEQNLRQQGAIAEANKIAQQRIGLILDNTALANRDAEKIRLNDNLKLVQDKRNAVDQELQILNLIAQGRDAEAKKLEDKIILQKEINNLMNNLNINEKDAINKVDQRLRLEKQIALNKLDQKKQIIVNNAIEENAQKKITLGLSKEEKARIRASKAYIQLDKQVQDLQGKADTRSLRMVADLEAKKAGKLDLILTDETKSELSKIETSRTEIETDFNLQLKALDERLIEIQNAEVKKKQDDAKREADLKKKQDEILAKAREAEDTLKDKLTEVGNKAKESIVDGFENVIQKLKDITVENNIEVNVDEALSNISSTLQNLPTPPAPVVMIPPFPDPAPISVSVDVDTESLLTEQTGLDIKEILDGKFVNQ